MPEYLPPVMRRAVEAVFAMADRIDDQGYDVSCIFEDLPVAVDAAIAPWKEVFKHN